MVISFLCNSNHIYFARAILFEDIKDKLHCCCQSCSVKGCCGQCNLYIHVATQNSLTGLHWMVVSQTVSLDMGIEIYNLWTTKPSLNLCRYYHTSAQFDHTDLRAFVSFMLVVRESRSSFRPGSHQPTSSFSKHFRCTSFIFISD